MNPETHYLPNFTIEELRCKGSGMLILAPGFGTELQRLRDAFGKPMVINSACRSKLHNAAVGGHPRSLHICDRPPHNTGGCCAVDVSTRGRPQEYRDELIELAWAMGWSVGEAATFVHLDRRTTHAALPQARFRYGS